MMVFVVADEVYDVGVVTLSEYQNLPTNILEQLSKIGK